MKFPPVYTEAEERDAFEVLARLRLEALEVDLDKSERRRREGRLLGQRNAIAMRNAGLAKVIAKRFAKGRRSLDEHDLFGCAMFGIFRAIEGFDVARGTRFVTYASPWVNQFVRLAVASDDLVRLPVNVKIDRRRIERHAEHAGVTTDDEVAADLGLSRRFVERVKALPLASHVPFDAPMREDGSATFGDTLAAPGVAADEAIDDREKREAVARALEALPHRQRAVLAARYGFEDGEDHTLAEVGERTLGGQSRERARQIAVQGLTTLERSLLHLRVGA